MKTRRYLTSSLVGFQVLVDSLLPLRASANPASSEAHRDELRVPISTVGSRPLKLWASPKIRRVANGTFMGHSSHRSHSSHVSHVSHASHASHFSSVGVGTSNGSSSSSGLGGSGATVTTVAPVIITTSTTAPPTTTTTIAIGSTGSTEVINTRIGKRVVYEKCWTVNDPAQRGSFIGRTVQLELRKNDGSWIVPPHVGGVLTSPESLVVTKCNKDLRTMSGITTWIPRKRGVFVYRQVVRGENGQPNLETSEVLVVTVR